MIYRDRRDPLARFISHIDLPESPCWEWQGALTSDGYGVTSLDGRSVLAHRAAYVMFRGKIPKYLVIDHLCRNRRCVNPSHLEVVTQEENLRRGINGLNRYKSHCKRGHEFTKENTHIASNGHWHCRTCRREDKRNERSRKREARGQCQTCSSWAQFKESAPDGTPLGECLFGDEIVVTRGDDGCEMWFEVAKPGHETDIRRWFPEADDTTEDMGS